MPGMTSEATKARAGNRAPLIPAPLTPRLRVTSAAFSRRALAFGFLVACAANGLLAKGKPQATATPVPTPSPTPVATPMPRPAATTQGLAVKWLRDSGEYAALSRLVYGFAARAVAEHAAEARQGGSTPLLAVVADIDETALDNSAYQLERLAYGLPYDPDSWDAWVARRQAGAVPGAAEFVTAMRGLDVRMAWISNRSNTTVEATRQNLDAHGLWSPGDALCLQPGDQDPRKTERRAQVRSGQGACSLGAPARVLAYVGDQLTDLPADGEEQPQARRAECLGARCFLLPNPMYGSWTRGVTRR
jgi:5'-nucleotidase (lipoprotein e(P4) family)